MHTHVVIQNNNSLPGATRKERYWHFCQTEFWKNLSHYVRARFPRCSDCGSTDCLQAHHKFYRDNWFDTLPDDLEVLCRKCHERRHESGKIPHRTAKPRFKKKRKRKHRGNRKQKTKALKREAWLRNQAWKRRHWSF